MLQSPSSKGSWIHYSVGRNKLTLGTGNYEYLLLATNANGCESSDTILLSVTLPVALIDPLSMNENPMEMIIYPNPGYDEIKLILPDSIMTDVHIKIFDMTGKLMKAKIVNVLENKNGSISVNDLQKGMYLIELKHRDVSDIQLWIKE